MDGFLPERGNKRQLNVLGNELEPCNFGLDKNNVVTGFYRDNCCNTAVDDVGLHTVCCIMTNEFLSFSKSVGNDLSTNIPEYNFPGLCDGDKWCLCASRWLEAFNAGKAPKVILKSTNIATLSIVKLEYLKKHAM
jgi:uncharacterized protein (DUF2237 family)